MQQALSRVTSAHHSIIHPWTLDTAPCYPQEETRGCTHCLQHPTCALAGSLPQDPVSAWPPTVLTSTAVWPGGLKCLPASCGHPEARQAPYTVLPLGSHRETVSGHRMNKRLNGASTSKGSYEIRENQLLGGKRAEWCYVLSCVPSKFMVKP